jgi:hypothetical protein
MCNEKARCIICEGELRESERLKCGHKLHKECNEWLKTNGINGCQECLLFEEEYNKYMREFNKLKDEGIIEEEEWSRSEWDNTMYSYEGGVLRIKISEEVGVEVKI